MTDNEIIQALECCIADVSCYDCPARGLCMQDFHCPKTIALDLIKCQQAEIESLTDERETLLKECKRCGRKTQKVIVKLKNKFKTAKAEAIKEFASRLKSEINNSIGQYWNGDGGGYYLAEDVHFDIDSLVEKMAGDDNDG